MSSQLSQVEVGEDIELDAVDRHFEPYHAAGCICMLEAPLWCDLGRCSQTVMVIINLLNLLQNPANKKPWLSLDYYFWECWKALKTVQILFSKLFVIICRMTCL